MAAQKAEDKQWSVLRRKAEKLVGLPSSEIDHQLGREVTRLIHEIQVNQAELEMQK